MAKILKPYTIIPPELYVQRDADKQVRNIIKDMGRPGYVLVSRQMGKTNLLLNAKRLLESHNDLFLYIDLSNVFPSAKGCFENIINTAFESDYNRFGKIAKEILERRKYLVDTPPHKQHTNELRLLLQELNGGKLVIILDEIDALIKTDYSDQIFSQIRSSYFASRVNFKEFFNLTYLLSGVIEPNEIIKDPKISPFNIGQKIYLNDFSKDEYYQFLSLSGLNLEPDVKERIFYWTSGNPRMTWDLCSEVENYQKKQTVELNTVDQIVQDLYLTSYDKPPIDNIRELVIKDKDIRNSIIEIEYHKGKQISDHNKSKLYLAGIINYIENDNVKIKNPIIKQSIQSDWIRSIEEQEKGLINLAMEEYGKNRYSETLTLFERYLESNQFPESPDTPHYYYIMGHCASLTRKYYLALEYFNKAEYNVEEEAIWFYKTMSQKGLMYYYLGLLDESLLCYKTIINNWKKDESYLKALINYGSIIIRSNNSEYNEEAINIFKGIISDDFKKERIKETFLNEIKAIAYFNLAESYRIRNEESSAIENLKKAVIIATDLQKPKIIVSLLYLNINNIDRKEVIDEMLKLLESGIEVTQDEQEGSLNFSKGVFAEFLIKVYEVDYKLFAESFKPFLNKIKDNSTYSNQIYELALYALNIQNHPVALQLITESQNHLSNEEDQEIKFNIHRLYLLLLPKFEVNDDYIKEYIDLFISYRKGKIDVVDFDVFIKIILRFIESSDYQSAIKCIEALKNIQSEVDENLLINYAAIFYFEINIYTTIELFIKAKLAAGQVYKLLNNPYIIKYKSKLLTDKDIEFIKSYAFEILNPTPSLPLNLLHNYERNEKVKVRYKDGTIVEAKYKKVMVDIESRKCFIITSNKIK